MMLSLLLLVAAATRLNLVDQVFEIPAADWRYVELHIQEQPVTVTCYFDTGPPVEVSLAFLERSSLNAFRQGLPAEIAAVARGSYGSLRHGVRSPGKYVVLVDNRSDSRRAARVHVRVGLDFSGHAGPHVRTLSPRRRSAVVVLSFAVFFGIVIGAGRMLLRGARP